MKIMIITNDNTTRPFSICKSGLHKLWHPGITILAARKWRYNEKMKRKWRESEEMERKLRENEEIERE